MDVPLPFANPQLEAARRVYTDKHPLGRDKEQLARLRAEHGRPAPAPAGGVPAAPGAAGDAAGAKPERLVEYAVSSSSGLVTAPAALALRSGAEPQAGADGRPPHGGGAPGARAGGQRPAATSTPAAGGKAGAAPPNTLRLGVKPVGTGLYPAKITLASPYDVRVLSVEVSAQSLGQSYALELECPARQQVRAREAVGGKGVVLSSGGSHDCVWRPARGFWAVGLCCGRWPPGLRFRQRGCRALAAACALSRVA